MPGRSRWLVGFSAVVLSLTVSAAGAGSGDIRLVEAAAEQNNPLLRTLLAQGVDVNAARPDGVTALHWAAHWDDREAADLLLGAGANVNAADDHGVTPLTRACENASEPMVTRLLRAGARPDASQVNGLTPLMMAARTGSVQVVKALLASGAKVNATTATTHETALMWAVGERHLDVVRTLIEAGADVHPQPGQMFSPLMRAAEHGDIEAATLLLEAGAGVNERGADGTSPLTYAIVSGQAAFAHFILDKGADPNGSMGGVTALHAAAGPVDIWLRAWNRAHGGMGGGSVPLRRARLPISDRLGLVKALLARGADPNARTTSSELPGLGFLRNGAYDTFTTGSGDVGGATPLWVAAYATNPGMGSASVRRESVESTVDVVRALLAAGARADIATNDETTTVMAASGCGRAAHTPNLPRGDRQIVAEEAVRLLVEAGVDVNAANEADFTALHCAAFVGANEILEYLAGQGANLDARDWRGRTAFRIAEGAKQSFHYQDWPETAALLERLGADPSLGIPGTVHERLRGLAATTGTR
jgi:ankyrin repeat protein